MIHAGVPEKVAAMMFSGQKTRLLFDRCSIINEACLRTAAGTIISLHKEVQERPNRIHRHILGTMWDRLRKKSPRTYGRKLLKTNRCVQTESHALCFDKLILSRQSPSLTRERVRVTAGPSPLVGSPMYLGNLSSRSPVRFRPSEIEKIGMIADRSEMFGQLIWLTVRGGEWTYPAVRPEVDWPHTVYEH